MTGGAFGSTATNAQPAGGLFGSTSAPQSQPTSGGGLFGNTTIQPAASGGLFPSTTTQPATGSGLFGGTAPQPAAGGGLFGGTSLGTQGSSGGGLFGNAATQPAAGGGLFGNTVTQPANTTTGGLFGNTTQNQGSSTTGGGLFGRTSASTGAPSVGLFGNTNTSATGTGGGLFGSTNTGTTGGLFGGISQSSALAQPGSSSFGQSQAQGSLFGGAGKPATVPLLGSTAAPLGANSLLSSRNPAQPAQSQADAHAQFAALQQKIEGIAAAWNASSPECRFQHFFYNMVDPAQVHLYGRPANATNDAAWQKAVMENPDPSCLVPVLAVGFDDLQTRVEAQTQQATSHQERLKELQTRIKALAQRHELSNSVRLQKAAKMQVQLQQRLLRLAQHLHLLIPSLRSSSIRPEEEALRAALEEIDEEIRRPGGLSRLQGRLSELWAALNSVLVARQRAGKNGDSSQWAVVDDEGLAQIAQILSEQQTGLAHLTQILQRDTKDLALMQGKRTQQPESELLSSTTSTLRGSLIL
ncbi:hypothetical protein PUNSTDRAFT_110559 [Punctularia strigosozonata HHB-11173 SS5]|uniref:uncharacterized protein n=1 Tax=Punctularia strigosozonata (strain HHB-11173) TaxID=741275 RepID=UPI0004416B0B|nr:uncharacterized protein PUNSTDRAFT_110559 [Punctularia strigosozonata HHB-11173 SS5]EIN14470.1 hypothetical protein PUNSTDRAFT_110559 [Punctularia strigosozonata HHB-11173 SS5]